MFKKLLQYFHEKDFLSLFLLFFPAICVGAIVFILIEDMKSRNHEPNKRRMVYLAASKLEEGPLKNNLYLVLSAEALGGSKAMNVVLREHAKTFVDLLTPEERKAIEEALNKEKSDNTQQHTTNCNER